jgi:hypothetical protein
MITKVAEDRREFLRGSALALAAVTVGNSISLLGCSSGSEVSALSPMFRSAGFDWVVRNLNGNVATLSLRAVESLRLNKICVDVAFGISSQKVAGGFVGVLCRGGIHRGAISDFESVTTRSGLGAATSMHFGSSTLVNPNNLSISSDQGPLQDVFYSVALKSWVPPDGVASGASRYVAAEPLLSVNAGEGIVFQMLHSGIAGDAGMKVVLEYK